MDVSDIKQGILLCRDAGITSFLWGHRGLGKSSLHDQVARSFNWGFINMRCSQMEASDLRGLPDKENGMTVYRHPSDLPHSHDEDKVCPACYFDKTPDANREEGVPRELFFIEGDEKRPLPEGSYCKGILFLDELNRAEDDVLQAGFELVLDYKVGLYRVPSGWSVHCAGNYMDGYMVNNFSDPAFLDRFCHLNLTNSEEYFKGWTEYMARYGEPASKIMQFVGFNPKHLIGDVKGEMGFSIQPSPRSWEFIARVEDACREKTYSRSVKRAVVSGIIGHALALSYEQFTCDLTPQDIMTKGIGGGNKQILDGLHRNPRVGLIWGLAAAVKNVKKTKGMMTNVIDFMEYLAGDPAADARDLAVSLGRALCSTETEELAGAMLSNPNLARLASRWKQRHGNKDELSWIKMINEREELQELMSKVSYGLSI